MGLSCRMLSAEPTACGERRGRRDAHDRRNVPAWGACFQEQPDLRCTAQLPRCDRQGAGALSCQYYESAGSKVSWGGGGGSFALVFFKVWKEIGNHETSAQLLNPESCGNLSTESKQC